jgi:hypothetical protein
MIKNLYYVVNQFESCECTYGPSHFCGDSGPDYLKGNDCLLGVLYTCVAKDIDAKISRNSPIKTCIHSHCPYGS